LSDDDIILDSDLPPREPVNPPSLYDINCSFDAIRTERFDGIKGEFNARMVVFTNYVLGKQCVLLKGSRASGKTCMVDVVTQYCKNPKNIDLASERADYRDAKSLNEATHFIISEINKTSKTFIEIMKDLGEGKDSTYKTVDAGRYTRELKIFAKPFISSLADENEAVLGEELLSRVTVIPTDSSREQNLRVIREKLMRAQNPTAKREVTQEDIKEFIKYVKELPDIKSVAFVYLPGESMMKAIPPMFTDSRRDIEKYMKNTFGITLFHYHERMIVEKGKKKYLLVTPLDCWYNDRIYGNIIVQSALKCGTTQRVILDILKAKEGKSGANEGLTLKQVHKEMMLKGMSPSYKMVEKYCEELYEVGYLLKNDSVRPALYEMNPSFKSDFKEEIDWREVVGECRKAVEKQFPNDAAEYVKRYCTTPIIAIDPFSGEEVSILDTPKVVVKENEEDKLVHERSQAISDMMVEEDRNDLIKREILKELEVAVDHQVLETLLVDKVVGVVAGSSLDVYEVLDGMKNTDVVTMNGSVKRVW